jgi:hypothetical protein
MRRAAPALLFLLLPALLGWGRLGHAVIADIAYRELTPEARARVDAIMGSQTIQETASWADGVRGRNDEFPWTAPLHYANLPADASAYDHATMKPQQGNVVSAVVHFAARVTDESLTDLERTRALMFLVHFVGDLHQPLHAGNAEDRGGNDIDIDWFGRPRRLHSIWDSGIYDATTNDPWPVLSQKLYETTTDEDRLAWTATDPAARADADTDQLTAAVGRWTLESRRFANTHAYQAAGFNEDQPFADGTELGNLYAEHCRPVTDLRLKQAGVRLGRLLNALLGETER